MEKNQLQSLIDLGYSTYKIAAALNVAQTTIRYWLKKYELVTNNSKKSPVVRNTLAKCCPKCKTLKLYSEFYNKRSGAGSSTYCKPCSNEQAITRQRAFKQNCVTYKGGSCQICGYNKTNNALEFHHLDPLEKDYTVSKKKLYSFDENIKKELDKCILVCANCHREIHAGIVEGKGIEPLRLG